MNAGDNQPPNGNTGQSHKAPAEWVSLSELVKWGKNPKHHDDRDVPGIARSIRRFGFGAPIVGWRSKRQVVAGHGRLAAADLLHREDPGALIASDAPGPGLVPVRWVEFASDAEAAAYAIGDNRWTERNPMDPEAVAEIIEEYGLEEGAGDIGYTNAEVAAMLGDTGDGAGQGAGDQSDQLRETFQVLVTCRDEDEQGKLLMELNERGLNVRSLIT